MDTEFFYDVVVIGAGHAGCEAAAAAARIGARTVLITMDMNKIAQMSCNPAIGGIAKGQIIREVDALGGGTGLVTDAAAVQFRMLNRSKGPAMWSPRAQCDRMRFIQLWRERLERQERLDIWQDEVAEILEHDGEAAGVRTVWGAVFHARSVVVTAGTFLNGLMHIGRRMLPGGRCAEPASTFLTKSIEQFGINSARMKTGTPVRIDARSVHFDELEVQRGETDYHRFSFISPLRPLPQLPCWTVNTNARVHEVLRSGLADSPLYNGQIKSIGPRYCPSIETKLVTFPDREQHPLFLEPEGLDTNELYLNGFSSSLPMDVQLRALREIPAFRDVVLYRPGYAIEYDFFDPTQLHHTLESKKLPGLYFAGQVNGTTGYEEAAGQGILAGINAAQRCGGGNALVLSRDEAYIGVLVDDLVTKGVDEPYRMFTSRAEYRILLRQDNADIRLTPYAERLGLATTERLEIFHKKRDAIAALVDFCKTSSVRPGEINDWLTQRGEPGLHGGVKLSELINRPQLSLENIATAVPVLAEELKKVEIIGEEISEVLSNASQLAGNEIPYPTGSFSGTANSSNLSDETLKAAPLEIKNHFIGQIGRNLPISAEIKESAEIEIKYEGYIVRERAQAEKMQRLEAVKLSAYFDYSAVKQLSTEARQKLSAIRPVSLAQASRIPGVSPSDVSVLLVLLGR